MGDRHVLRTLYGLTPVMRRAEPRTPDMQTEHRPGVASSTIVRLLSHAPMHAARNCRSSTKTQPAQLTNPKSVPYGANRADASTATPASAPRACPTQTVFMQELLRAGSCGPRKLIKSGNTKEKSSKVVRTTVSCNVSSRIAMIFQFKLTSQTPHPSRAAAERLNSLAPRMGPSR